MRAHDWSASHLGCPEHWPQSLKTVVRILVTSRFQMWMGWGEELTFFYNDAYRPTLGVKAEWALGASAKEVWKEIWPDIGPRIQRVLNTGEATWDEGLLLFLERSGYPEETYHTFSYSPLADDDGKTTGILCVVTEETERIIGERRLATLRELASNISGKNTRKDVNAAIGDSLERNLRDLPFSLVYLLDHNGQASLVCSSGVDASSSLAPTEIDTNSANATWPLAAVMETRRATTVSLNNVREVPQGSWNIPPRQAIIVPIAKQGENAAAGFLIVGINPYRRDDDTYRGFLNLLAGQIASGFANADAYEEERRRAEALAEIDRAKTAFFSNASHEFRTPLTLMLSPLEDLLAREPGDAGVAVARSELDLMKRNGIRLLKLVNTLLDFSRIEAGRMQSAFEPVDLSAYTKELASTFRSAMEKAGLDFRVECLPLPQPVFVDRDMWEKIVLNLVSNAFKYTLSGGVLVSLRPNADGASAILEVTDTGVGIPAEELPHLFERFHRVANQSGRTLEGTGIGLALVQELVHLHHGSVQVKSAVGSGSSFSVTIPFGSGHLPNNQVRDHRSASTARVTADAYVTEALRWLPEDIGPVKASISSDLLETKTEASREKPLVLVVDDNSDMRGYVSRLLSDRYRVETARDGNSALASIRGERPDLILSDIMMPELDGFGLLKAIRSEPALRDLPVILLSARAGEESSVEGLETGADDYLVKPFSARELLARVRANLDMAKLRREALETENQLRREAQASKERAESILASIKDGFFVVDKNWRFTFMNAAAEKLMGRSAESFYGRTHWEEYPESIGTPLEFHYRRAMAERTSIIFENFYTPWQRWFELRVYPEGEDGLSVYFQDVTERKAAEDALKSINETLEAQVASRTEDLRSKEAQLRAVFETSFTYQGLISLDGKVLDMNTTSLDGIGATFGDVLGAPFWNISWFSGTPGMPEDIRDAIRLAAKGNIIRKEIYVNIPIGGWRWFDFQLRPVRNEGDDIIAIALEAVELTARRQAEEALRQSQKMEAIGQLTGGVAHDFNNLLTIIRSSADLLRLQNLPDERRRRYVDAISDTADRAAKLTGQLLAFSRRQALNPQVFDAVHQVEGIMEMLKTIVGSQIELDLNVINRPLAVEADPNQFETALINLVANARDAIAGAGRLTIGITHAQVTSSGGQSSAFDSFAAVSVTDTGCGIPADQLEKIFEPFFTTKEVGRGTGLGLSQVYGFAKQSGGSVSVDSQVGRGTTFTIHLPLTAKMHDNDRRPNATDAGLRSVQGCVLVVEDNCEVAEFSSQLLKEFGFDVVLVSNATDALKIIDEDTDRFALVFSDVVMPGMDGLQLTREIARRAPSLPVILTSGYSHVLAAQDNHGFAVLRKPYSVEDLASALRGALKQSKRIN